MRSENEASSPGDATRETRRAYRSLSGVTAALVSLLVVGIVVDAVAVVSDILEYRLIVEVAEGRAVSAAEAASSDRRQAAIGLVQFAVFLATATLFIVWTYRAYSNLEPLGARNMRFGRGWAVGGWLVPILWYWRPKQIWNDIWRASDPELGKVDPDWRHVRPPGIGLAWWLTFVLSMIFAWGAFRLTVAADSVREFRTASTGTLLADAASVAAGILAIVVVRRTTQRQRDRAQRVAADASRTD